MNPRSHKTRVVSVNSVQFGGGPFVVIAGPCSIESREQMLNTGMSVKRSGAVMLRGGIFKLRTDPSSFQGLGSDAFRFINEVKAEIGLSLVSEITDPRQIHDMATVIDMFQVGSRNMYNYALLKELGQLKKPVLLKRGFSATVKEWLLAAEYLCKGGNENIVLCERGIRTFETATRNTLDLNAVAYVKARSDFPVLVDPSHGTGMPEIIPALSMASAACGADGLLIEVHPDPEKALSDGFQALTISHFDSLMQQVSKVLGAVGRTLHVI